MEKSAGRSAKFSKDIENDVIEDAKGDARPEPKTTTTGGRGDKSEFRSEKARLMDEEDDAAVDAEFEAMKKVPNVGRSEISSNPSARQIVEGFRLNWMNMRDASTGKLVWESHDWGSDMFEVEMRGLPLFLFTKSSQISSCFFPSTKSQFQRKFWNAALFQEK